MLRPVGEPLAPIREDIHPEDVLPAGFRADFVQSGTAALALALLTVKGQADASRRRVVLPAYGCPDLVAATLYAGLEPYLVDTAADSPFYDQEALSHELDDRVLAVVCVHFLGFREQVAEVTSLASRAGAVVIEDSAQALPPLDGAGLADLVVMSFGRGKPAGALGGGCLLLRGARADALPVRHIGTHCTKRRLPLRLRRLGYNFAITPELYGPLSRLAFLGIGETKYRPLDAIQPLNASDTPAALSQIHRVISEAIRTETRAKSLLRALPHDARLAPAPWVHTGIGSGIITRLPLIAPTHSLRDRLHERLLGSGLGSSVMYGRWLPEITGIPPLRLPSSAKAKDFAKRILTLPVHSGLLQPDVARVVKTVRLCLVEPTR